MVSASEPLRGLLARIGPLVVIVMLASSLASAETPEAIFERGNDAYEKELYADAVKAYETLLRYRIRDPRVEYNLGNAYFRLGELGRAILHFERARRLAPTDSEILGNLEFARSYTLDSAEPDPAPLALRSFRDVQDRLGPDRQAWASLLSSWLLAGWLAWTLARPGRWKPAYGWLLAAGVLWIALLTASWYVTFDRLEGQRLAVVLEDSVEVLAGPGENNATLFTIHEGLTIEVRDVRSEWVQVSLPNGLNGWLPADVVELV
jgi:tetratricopeptide (TPR) repeat protein